MVITPWHDEEALLALLKWMIRSQVPEPPHGGSGCSSQTRRRWGSSAPAEPLRYSRAGPEKRRVSCRYRRSLNHKLCELGIGRCYFLTRSAPYTKVQVSAFRGEYGRKAET